MKELDKLKQQYAVLGEEIEKLEEANIKYTVQEIRHRADSILPEYYVFAEYYKRCQFIVAKCSNREIAEFIKDKFTTSDFDGDYFELLKKELFDRRSAKTMGRW